jgi:putative FmdB family regulatory protein
MLEEHARIDMPIYEYVCEECDTRFERIVLNKREEIACPKCASKKASIQLSVFATSTGNGNGASAKSSSFPGGNSGGGSCCGGGCGCN